MQSPIWPEQQYWDNLALWTSDMQDSGTLSSSPFNFLSWLTEKLDTTYKAEAAVDN
ncbi:hypothetical protein CY34DRAFT_19780 [Suillus luteus UH-Slu-Lm8-n1]|uniref:Uncharacterized protein n=1 Tax=Suillus luteus UH-Slu-Lm8-n1 TaxID=930992 RepID=A0A0D0A092_9AGAM|nr:hypothetical protein CY34DRAFT_19780 [Suillus luteus UH-Slu-Lm8-n1]